MLHGNPKPRSALQPGYSRRDWLRLATAGAVGFSMSGWLARLAAYAAGDSQRRKSCILLWMGGGPSQMDTFDLKPGHANGGPFKEIATSVPGIRMGEHLPKMARHMNDMALIRSMSTKEGDHNRGTFYLHTGYLPQGRDQYPTLGALVAKELGDPAAVLPNFISIAPFRDINRSAFEAGYLGPQHAPLFLGDHSAGYFNMPASEDAYHDGLLQVQDLALPPGVNPDQLKARLELLGDMEREFSADRQGGAPASHQAAYAGALRLLRAEAIQALRFTEEKDAVRDAYGKSMFGQGCLLARRFIERGVPFVEVGLGGVNRNTGFGWDTHENNFARVQALSGVLDQGWSALMTDLKERGLLESTLIVWMGEFGRTPKINKDGGRDHWPASWTAVLAGGGIRGGQALGKTSADGMTVEDRPVAVPDLFATVCRALGIDPTKRFRSNHDQRIPIADKTGKPISEVLS